MLLLASAVVLLLVVLNGVFAMSELAVVSSRKQKLQSRAERGDKGAAAALLLAEDPTRFLSSVQVGITLIGILAGAFGQATIAAEFDKILENVPGFADYSEAISTGVVVVVLTYLSLIVGELVPKRLALLMPETIAAVVARPLTLMAAGMGPFVTFLTGSTAAVLMILRIKDVQGDVITQEEVETVLAEGAGAGIIEPEERAMMHEVMRLGDRPVRVAMTPRREVYWVSLDDPEEVLRNDIRTCPYSRFVVSRSGSVDDPLGVAHKAQVADALLAGEPLDLESMVRAPLYIPETTTVLKTLELFKSSPTHMAFIVDEFGSLEGVVTPTDLLEMIAGDFNESHDEPEARILRREDGSYLVDGRSDLFELGDIIGEDLSEGQGYHTVAGLVLNRLGRFPTEGEILRLGGYEVEVVDMDGRRIDKLIFREAQRRP
ncbi:hemolysin family protein [Phenylobacterium sp.]|uniref:hemolysin family protein n=1 Tax=Phenylobacterium sp. TaxID=1871053 RepID=UPI002737F484|nr:hemolysin family protein [Phenylobacterium sp.]MDP3870729.1 hemolysin family protein [Phenylobacterium sp.]